MKFEWDERKNQSNLAKHGFDERHFLMNADAMNNTSRTDWARIDAMSDADIDTSDIPPLSEEFFAKAKLRMPRSAVKVSV
jgi:hypothetical protein